MTLVEVIKVINFVASRQPSVNMIVENDVFRLNEKADARYGVFAWTQGQHSASTDSDYMNFSFTFFYVDRLKNDLSNQLEIQSVGTQTLSNIIRALDDYGVYCDTSFSFQVFNQRFADECAGVYCNVILSVPITATCPEFFMDFDAGDFNDDFNTFGTRGSFPDVDLDPAGGGRPVHGGGGGGGYGPLPSNLLKYYLCADEAEYESISPKDPGTLYLIPEQ